MEQLRLSICNSCENNILGICKVCGCIIKIKVLVKSTSCPKDKWISSD
jgi:hypothetical protein